MTASITCTGLTFAWPDGTVVLDHVDATFGPGRTGVIGANGTGKSTLLRLLAGELSPTAGTVRAPDRLAHLPQDLRRRRDATVDDLLGIRAPRAALLAIEGGATDPSLYEAVGDDWDVEERATAVLDRLGLGGLDLDRPVAGLSGGETTLLGLAGRLLTDPEALLLDEPTNDLDRAGRGRLLEVLREWRGPLVVVSHDRELLGAVDAVAELRAGQLRLHGGDLDAFEAARAVEQAAARQAVTTAEADLARQRRERIDAGTTLDRRARYGRRMAEQRREPKIVMGARRRSAQVSAGKLRDQLDDREQKARDRLAEARAAVVDDEELRLELPASQVPERRRVARLVDVVLPYGPTVSLEVHGPQRIALTGRNGSGKTTLLRVLAGEASPSSGSVEVSVPTRHLPQTRDLLDDELSVVDNVARRAPTATTNEVRARLAQLLFRGGAADQLAGTLSGGERLRATLATLLLGDPTPQLLLLDEPTNDLDRAGVAHLTAALAAHRGALVVVSHDLPFLRAVGPTRWVALDEDGLHEIRREDLASG